MNHIEIYSSDKCLECKKAKEYFDENNLEYIEHNVFKVIEAKRELIRMGYMSLPVIIINGNHVLGFDLNRIKKLINE